MKLSPNIWLALVVLLAPLCCGAAWEDVVPAAYPGGWQQLDLRWAYDAGGNWKYLPEARAWIYVIELEDPVVPPDGFVPVPAGSFEMGDSLGDGYIHELPLHTVHVAAFYIQRTEVTKEQWDDVAGWAQAHGYDISPAGGSGKGSGHPVHYVSWYECAKYANAKSEREGLTPAYMLNGSVFRKGVGAPGTDFAADGYRLPTEAEWEKAARGGLHGRRFPWGDTISHGEANYNASSSHSYEVSPTRGLHPDWDTEPSPYTSPAGTFAANGYGLHDMAGNLSEWCNDWYSETYYSSSPSGDPTGPASGSNRVMRGGFWNEGAYSCRVSHRYTYYPRSDGDSYSIGFRLVRRVTR
jgi:formylglycine-generating enzyme required for sulfatase activity